MKRLFVIIAAMTSLSACADALAPGQNEGVCDKNPEKCASVRQAMKQSDGPVVPPPSEVALQRGDVMRVWVAPMRTPAGVLTNSGHIFVE